MGTAARTIVVAFKISGSHEIPFPESDPDY
jgi:hypothetical protein